MLVPAFFSIFEVVQRIMFLSPQCWQKSHGSGHYGSKITVLFFTQKSQTSCKVWAGALSWSTHEPNVYIINNLSNSDSAIFQNNFLYFFDVVVTINISKAARTLFHFQAQFFFQSKNWPSVQITFSTVKSKLFKMVANVNMRICLSFCGYCILKLTIIACVLIARFDTVAIGTCW